MESNQAITLALVLLLFEIDCFGLFWFDPSVSLLISINLDFLPHLNFVLCFVVGVMMAARSLIQLFRAVNPALLHKKDRASKLFVL